MEIKFIEEEGIHCKYELTIYALSTCGFCRRALRFLRENSIKFKYVYFDELDSTAQDELEETIKAQYGQRLSFPFAVINCEKTLIGFDQEKWEKEFL